jgi:nitrite reductase/ring-hydroxylating ferredoxin subunit
MPTDLDPQNPPPILDPRRTTDSPYTPPSEREIHTLAPDGTPPERQPVWRRDFPIDWPQDHYVARRDFTKFMVLTSLAFAVGQFWIGAKNYLRKSRGKPPIVKVASLAALPVGGMVFFKYPEAHDGCVLIRTGVSTLLAYSRKCTHLACAVVPRPEHNEIHCPCHEGYFELSTGRPTAGPPQRPLPRITLEVRGGSVYAVGVEARTI